MRVRKRKYIRITSLLIDYFEQGVPDFMLFQSHCFWYPKDLEYAHTYEDSFCLDGERGIATVSDGVSSAMFSKEWANLMTTGIVEATPDVKDWGAFQDWLAKLRAKWSAAVDVSKLNYFQRRKLQDVGGGYATLLWVQLSPVADGPDDEQESDNDDKLVNYSLCGWAAGDCCLFLVRDGAALCKFPLADEAEFNLDPTSVCSVDQNRDDALEFRSVELTCRSGDFVVLASDAFAKWLYHQLEAERPIDWETLWSMSEDAWCQLVQDLRGLSGNDRMRVDDTTLMMLRLADRSMLENDVEVNNPTRHHLVFSPISASGGTDGTPEIVADDQPQSLVQSDGSPVVEEISTDDDSLAKARQSSPSHDTEAEGSQSGQERFLLGELEESL